MFYQYKIGKIVRKVIKQADLLMHNEEFEILFNMFDKKFDK